jgi:hypothetical protein
MVRLTGHLVSLLATHDCVVIPTIGGFVVRTLPSVHKEEDHTFSPMRRDVGFNGDLVHSDGLLVSSYASIYGKSFEEAQTMMEEDIAELQGALERNDKVSLGALGTLSYGEEGQLVFTAGNADVFGADTYGLSSFSVPVLPPQAEPASPPKRKGVLHVRMNKKVVRGVAAAVVVVAVAVAIPLTVSDRASDTYEAAVLPAKAAKEASPAPVNEQQPEQAVVQEAVAPEEVVPAEVKTEPEKVVSPVTKPTPEAVVVDEGGKYYVVVGSFPEKEKASVALAAYQRSAKTSEAGIVQRDGKFRIYAGNYASRTKAKVALARIRQHSRYKDAWIFVDK